MGMSSGVRVKTEPFDFGLLQLSLKLLEHPPSDRENGVQPTTSEEADRRKVDSFFQAIGALLQQLLQELGRFTDSTTLGLFGDEGPWVPLALEHFGWDRDTALALHDVFCGLHKSEETGVDRQYLIHFALFLAIQGFSLFPHGGVSFAAAKSQAIKWPAVRVSSEHNTDLDPCTPDLSGRSLLRSSLASESEYRNHFVAANMHRLLWVAAGVPGLLSDFDEMKLEDDKSVLKNLSFLLDLREGKENDSDFFETVKSCHDLSKECLGDVLVDALQTRLTNEEVHSSQNIPYTKETLVIDAVHKAARILPPGSAEVAGKHALIIKNCQDANIYLLDVMENVRIVGCDNSTLVLGPVTGTLSIDLCENLTVIAPINLVMLKNSVDCRLCIYTKTRPLFCGDFRGILVGPYCTSYDQLRAQLKSSNFISMSTAKPKDNQMWKSPVALQSVSTPEACSEIRTCSPQEFCLLSIPMKRSPSGAELLRSLPFELSAEIYEEQLRRWREARELLEDLDRELEGKGELKKDIIRLVQASFRDWLHTSGNIKQVVDLVKVEHSNSSG